MDFLTASILLQSEDEQKQLSALKALIPLFEDNWPPTDDVISAIIERGLTSEKDNQIRKLSFDCIRKLYKFRIRNWNEVRAAIVTELGTADSSLALLAAVDVLNVIPKKMLINFVGSKEGISAIKSCCFSNDSEIRATAVKKLGMLLINIWQLVDNSREIEGLVVVDSTSEARRFREDIRDFIKDFIKDLAYGAIGKPKGIDPGIQVDDIKIVSLSFCQVINCILRIYNESHNVIKIWIFSLLGILTHTTVENTESEIIENSVCLIPLLKIILPVLCSNLYSFISRCQQTSFALEMTSTLSILILTLLNETFPGSTSSIGIEMGPRISDQFSTDINDNVDILSSVVIPLPVNIVQLATEWVTISLMQAIRSHNNLEVLQCAKDSLLIVQDERLSLCRYQVCTIVLDNLIRILPTNSSTIQQQQHNLPMTSVLEIISLSLLAARYVSKESTLVAGLSRLCVSLDNVVTDDMIRTRLLTELVMTIITDSANGGLCTHPHILKDFLNDHFVASALSEASSAQRTFRVRITAALLRGTCRIIPIVLKKTLKSLTSGDDSDNGCLHVTFLQGDPWFAAASSSSWDGIKLHPTTATTDSIASSEYLHDTVGLSNHYDDILQFQNILTNAMLLANKFSRCLSWPVAGSAGQTTVLCYIQLLQLLCSLFLSATDKQNDDNSTMTDSSTSTTSNNGIMKEKTKSFQELLHLPIIASLRKRFKEFLQDDIINTKLSLKLPSSPAKIQLLKLLGVYLAPLCSHDEGVQKVVGGLLFDEVKNNLMTMSRRESYFQSLKSDSWCGQLGGGSARQDFPPHNYTYMSIQWDCLDILEKTVLRSPILSMIALEILNEFRNVCKYEIIKTMKDLSPVLLEKAELVTRRIIEICPSGNSILSYAKKSLTRNEQSTQHAVSNATNKMSLRINHLDLLDIGGPKEDNVMPALLRPSSEAEVPAIFLASLTELELYAHGDIVDKASEDPGLEFGMWSTEAISYFEPTDSDLGTNAGKQVCTADVVGLIDDVINSHFAPPCRNSYDNSNNGRRNNASSISNNNSTSALIADYKEVVEPLSTSHILSGLPYLRNVLGSLSSDPRLWKTLSGGGDIFTVQCCLQYNAANYSVAAVVRITNSSGFKVPSFTLQLLVHFEDNDSILGPAVSPYCNAVTEYDGAEYFHCNSMIETHFPLNVLRFDLAAISIRITFRDLTKDSPSDFFLKSDVTSKRNIVGGQSTVDIETSEVPSLSIFSSNNKNIDASLAVTKMIMDSQPLTLSLVQYVVPYGTGSLSSLSRFSGHLSGATPGIPKAVFTSLWDRCMEGGNMSVMSVLPSRVTGISLSELVTEAVTLYNGYQRSSYTKVIGMNSRVNLSNIYGSERKLTNNSDKYISTLAWALQTWWGDEVAVLVTAYRGSYSLPPNPYVVDSTKRSVMWCGRVEIRSSSRSVVEGLLRDIDAFICALSGGIIEICRLNFGYNILHNDVAMLLDKSTITGSIPPILGTVQNAPNIIN